MTFEIFDDQNKFFPLWAKKLTFCGKDSTKHNFEIYVINLYNIYFDFFLFTIVSAKETLKVKSL